MALPILLVSIVPVVFSALSDVGLSYELGLQRSTPGVCCTLEECVGCYLLSLEQGDCPDRNMWCGCHGDAQVCGTSEEAMAELSQIMDRHTTQKLLDAAPRKMVSGHVPLGTEVSRDISCCSVGDCWQCFWEEVGQDFWCGFKAPWCGCTLIDCSAPPTPPVAPSPEAFMVESLAAQLPENLESLSVLMETGEGDVRGGDDSIECCSVGECTSCFFGQVASHPFCGFRRLWCGCTLTDCEAEAEDEDEEQAAPAPEAAPLLGMNELSTSSALQTPYDPTVCCSKAQCVRCFLDQVADDLACPANDQWCGCHHDDVICGGTDRGHVTSAHPLHVMKQLSIPVEEADPDLSCCTLQECHTCFLSQMGEDPKCGLNSLWCGCHQVDCSNLSSGSKPVVF